MIRTLLNLMLPGTLLLAQRGSGQALYVGLGEDLFIVASEPYGVVEETTQYLRVDGETPSPTGSRGQVFVLDGAKAGALEGIRRMAYDGTELPLGEREVVTAQVTQKLAGYGLQLDGVGVKDIVLPGEMKTILAQVVEAGKAAEANVIRRREETAATRSLLNTAKVMEDNPVALRLKELETLERVAERIDKISVFGGLDAADVPALHADPRDARAGADLHPAAAGALALAVLPSRRERALMLQQQQRLQQAQLALKPTAP